MVACANREGRGDAHLQVDPAYRFLEPEMIEFAEEALAAPGANGNGKALEFTVYEYDVLRQRVLSGRGYRQTADWGMFRHMRLPLEPLPAATVAEPYEMRPVNPADDADCERIADLLNAAFHRTFHNGPEYQQFARLSPCYVNELDLAAVAPDGSFAAYVGMPYDTANHRGIFEPVCTHPDHLRHGLAGSLMREALHRVQALGAVDATVDTGDMVAANALYDSLGFTEAYRAYTWRKEYA
jgi:GNAT superfamily N-acetyltransferase